MDLKGKTIGYAITASYCTFSKVPDAISALIEDGANIVPIMSYNSTKDSRFGRGCDFVEKIMDLTGRDIILTIGEAEPIGPKALLDALVVAPCTGNTLAKLANGITDTPVTMAVKAHLRNNRPVVIAVSTNDALSANAINIGKLLNTKGYYFVPFFQDDTVKKPHSLIANMKLINETLKLALDGKQIEPLIGFFESLT